MTKLKHLHAKWMDDPEYRQAYDSLEEEFSLAMAMAQARVTAGLSQEEVARRMKTSQSTIARLEAGQSTPSTRTLTKFAEATGTRLKISFELVHGG